MSAKGEKAAQVAENTFKFLTKNGLYILAVLVGVFVLIWIYRLLFPRANKAKSGAQAIDQFIADQTAAGSTPSAISNAIASIEQTADNVLEMYQAYNPAGTYCTTTAGKTYDIVLQDIIDMGTVQVKSLCQFWAAEYAEKTATKVAGIYLSGPFSLYDVIKQERSGYLSCLTDSIKQKCLQHLEQNGCK